MKLIDERKFDAINLGWQVNSLENDPKQIFHSASMPSPGHNFVSYSNPALDKLIDQMRIQLDKKKRLKLFWKLSELIADDQPYTFLFNRKFSVYAHSARIKKAQDTLKYSIGSDTWSVAGEVP
jgi:ABC-type transport system substrate-binding protein